MTKIVIIFLIIIILLCLIYLIYQIYNYISFSKSSKKDKDNKKDIKIYRDANSAKIYNPDDIFPDAPGKYSRYLKPYLGQPSASEPFCYTISKNGFLLNSISNLPPNIIVLIVLDDFAMRLKVNNEGILYFNDNFESLPIGLMSDIKNVYFAFINNEMQSITHYDPQLLYSNNIPYNTPIGNYIILNEIDKNKYIIPYNMTVDLTGICPPCCDPNSKLISNITFIEKTNLVIDNDISTIAGKTTKTMFYPISGQNYDCRKICSEPIGVGNCLSGGGICEGADSHPCADGDCVNGKCVCRDYECKDPLCNCDLNITGLCRGPGSHPCGKGICNDRNKCVCTDSNCKDPWCNC